MKRSLTLLAMGLFLAAFGFSQAVTTTDNYKWEWVDMVWPEGNFSCVNEDLILNGIVHVVLHETTDAAGTVHIKMHYQPQRLQAVGAVSGDKYIATGVDQFTYKFAGVNFPLYIETFVENVNLISQKNAMNIRVRLRTRITINANGFETVYIEIDKLECK